MKFECRCSHCSCGPQNTLHRLSLIPKGKLSPYDEALRIRLLNKWFERRHAEMEAA